MKEVEKNSCTCPNCNAETGQMKNGKNRSGAQSMLCRYCGKSYTPEPKRNAYSEEVREMAIKIYYAGASGRGVGKVLGMSKANVYNWIKKTAQNLETNYQILEFDELYWFVGAKSRTQTRENAYVCTMVSRKPRQIVGFDAAFDKFRERIQAMVDTAPPAEKYCSDGYLGYIDVVYPGAYIRNVHNKNDTFTVEGVNADLRHYIPLLRRRSRCFPRKLETLYAVIKLFVQAYNAFGLAKMNFRKNRNPKSRKLPFSVLDFLQSMRLPTPC
jgi:transposase-like protein/IS1 family transposase